MERTAPGDRPGLMLCTIGLDLLLTVSAPFLLFSPLFTSVCVFISTVCFLVRYLFWLLLSLSKTITFSPSLCRHFSVYQWKLKHAIMKFFTWFWIWLISNIEEFCWTKNNYAFFSLFLTFKRTLWMIYSSRNRIYFTH